MISALGWITVLRYFLGNLALPEAMDRISNRLGCKAGFVIMPCPESAIDVDSASDWILAQQIAEKKS